MTLHSRDCACVRLYKCASMRGLLITSWSTSPVYRRGLTSADNSQVSSMQVLVLYSLIGRGVVKQNSLLEKNSHNFLWNETGLIFEWLDLVREVLDLAVPIAKLKECPEDMRIKWLAPESHCDGMFSRLHPKDIWVNPFFCVHPMDVVATVIHELTHQTMMEIPTTLKELLKKDISVMIHIVLHGRIAFVWSQEDSR